MSRRSLRMTLALAVPLVLPACGPQSTLGQTPTPEQDAAAQAFQRLEAEVAKDAPSAEAVEAAYRAGLEAQVVAGDAALAEEGEEGPEADAAIEAALLRADALDLIDVRNHALVSLTLQVREGLEHDVTDKYPGPSVAQDELLAAWDRYYALWQGLKPLAEQQDAASGDAAAREVEEAFTAGNVAIRENDAARVMASQEVIAKTLLRVLNGQLLREARAAFTLANPTEAHFRAQRRALGALWAVADRMAGRNDQGLVKATRMLTRTPTAGDVEALEHELAVTWAQRTYGYAHFTDTEMLGTPRGYASAMEGRTYFELVLPDLKEKVPGADVNGALRAWGQLADAILANKAADAQAASAILEKVVCDYQKALGFTTCTKQRSDLTAAASTLGATAGQGGANAELKLTLDQVAQLVSALGGATGATPAELYTAPVQAFFQAADTTLGRDGTTGKERYEPVIAAGVDGAAGEDARRAARWTARQVLLELFKKESKRALTDVTLDTAKRLEVWDANHLYAAAGWKDLAQEVDAALTDTSAADLEAAFVRGNVGLQDADEFETKAARQQAEKTTFRVLFHVVNARAAAARAQDSAALQAEAAWALALLGDRVSAKLSIADYDALKAELTTVAPAGMTLANVRTPMLRAFALRTFVYTRHAVVSPDVMGTSGGYENAAEGDTYFKLIERDLLAWAAAQQGAVADAAVWHKLWARWGAAIQAGHTTRGTDTSAFLSSDTTGVCGFAKAMGAVECK